MGVITSILIVMIAAILLSSVVDVVKKLYAKWKEKHKKNKGD